MAKDKMTTGSLGGNAQEVKTVGMDGKGAGEVPDAAEQTEKQSVNVNVNGPESQSADKDLEGKK